MGLDSAIHALSNFNAIMGSTMGYINDKQNGVSTGNALTGFGYNIINGAMRNEVSREILNHTGSYMGYAVNSAAGYGSDEANYKGTVGTMAAAMLSSPFGIFGCNPYMTSVLYGGYHGYYGGMPFGLFGGGCCNNYGMGIRSFFSPHGFYC